MRQAGGVCVWGGGNGRGIRVIWLAACVGGAALVPASDSREASAEVETEPGWSPGNTHASSPKPFLGCFTRLLWQRRVQLAAR